jgi:hypothetical protein
MALSNTQRWIMVGSLIIRNHKNAPVQAPSFNLQEIISAAKKRIISNDHYREYGKDKSRLMWFSELQEDTRYHNLLVNTGDKNTSGPSFVNFETRKSRDIEKNDNEGNHYNGHILIRKKADSNGNHLILVEKVPGIYFSILKEYFGWVCRDDRFKKSYKDEEGIDKTCTPIFEIDGHQSKTIREALQGGKLHDVEFVKHEKDCLLDEDTLIKDVIHHAKWDVKREVSEEEAKKIFSMIRPFLNNFTKKSEDTQTFVRIKTVSGQINRTSIDVERDEILEQVFIQNEIVKDFNENLNQRHDALRQDMIRKMAEIADNLGF